MHRFWDPQQSGATGTDNKSLAPTCDFRVGGNSTVVMSDYHICKYDPLLGVLVCIGDDSDVLVLGKRMCRALLPLQKGKHWLDCFIFAGTSTFIVLSPDSLVCMDYSVQGTSHSLLPPPQAGSRFTCMHVPQGLTVGAVGFKDGTVSFFRVTATASGGSTCPQLVWTTKTVDVLTLCEPFCGSAHVCVDRSEASLGRFFSIGSVLAIDSYPDNPDAFIAVVAGVPGVCKLYLGEGRVSCFFDAKVMVGSPDGDLAACKVTPGGNFVAAVTTHSTKVLLWSEKKKRSDKTCEAYWAIDLAAVVPSAGPLSKDPFWFNEYGVGLHMARTGLSGESHTKNDKHSHMYMLVYGRSQITEVVARMDDKVVLRKEPIIAHLNAHTAHGGVAAAAVRSSGDGKASTSGTTTHDGGADLVGGYFHVFHVEPCVLSNYWQSGLTDVDLEALFVTSADGLRPLLVKRSRQPGGGVESITELQELDSHTAWYPRALALRLPHPQLRELAVAVQRTPSSVSSALDVLLRAGDALLEHAISCEGGDEAESGGGGEAATARTLLRQSVVVTVTDAAQCVLLSPRSNETFAVPQKAVSACVPWSSIASGRDPADLVLERALPCIESALLPTELLLRVYATDTLVMVMKNDVRHNKGTLLLTLDRSQLELEDSVKGQQQQQQRMVRSASLVDLRLLPPVSSTSSSTLEVHPDGKSLLLVLEDHSIAIVDLSSRQRPPAMQRLPTGLLPGGAQVQCADVFWRYGTDSSSTTGAATAPTPYLAVLFAGGAGFLVWDLRRMRMVSYSQPPYVQRALHAQLAAAPPCPLPNLSGDVTNFEVTLTAERNASHGYVGTLHCIDSLGSRVFSLQVAFVDGGAWGSRRAGDDDGEFTPAQRPAHASTSSAVCLVARYQVVDATTIRWCVCYDDGTDLSEAEAAQLQWDSAPLTGSIIDVCAEWRVGRAQLQYDGPNGEMRSYAINMTGAGVFSSSSSLPPEPTVAFVSSAAITVVELAAFFTGTTIGGTPIVAAAPAVCKLDATRKLEHLSVFHGRGALLVVTCDANGWRWVNLLDSRTAEPRMEPYATLDFAGEERVQALYVEVDGILHLYFLGANNGVVGHFFVETSLDPRRGSSVRKRAVFAGRGFHPLPSTFRGYGRYLPPQPTLKQETGFFKRLMTLPWEEIALKLESQTLIETKLEVANASPSRSTEAIGTSSHDVQRQSLQTEATRPAAPMQPQSPLATQQSTNNAPPQGADALFHQPRTSVAVPSSSTAATKAPQPSSAAAPAGGRYAQLKAIAERENVTLNEARRMMSENVRKLQERGEKLNELQNKSAELADNALTFQELARQLKEKQRSSWI